MEKLNFTSLVKLVHIILKISRYVHTEMLQQKNHSFLCSVLCIVLVILQYANDVSLYRIYSVIFVLFCCV